VTAPKCTSWLGHKFEARFDIGAKVGGPVEYEGSALFVLELEKLKQSRTYVHDICVRCGHVVQRPSDKGAA
jgi:hypothetical protein